MVAGPVTATELAALIGGGEDSFTEFKAADTSTRDVAKELCAFLNSAGGRLLLGVEDNGQVTGLGAWDEERVMNVARTNLEPAAVPTWQVIDVLGASVAVVSVERGTDKPYAVGGGEGKRYYVRVGTTSREASRDELIRLTQASGAVQADLRPVPGSSVADLDFEVLGERFGSRRSFDWAAMTTNERISVLASAEILHPDNGSLTVGGVACYATRPGARLPQAEISCVAYPGTAPGREIVDRMTSSERVDAQVRAATAFVDRNLARSSTVEGVDRVERARPPEETLRELIANAVAHRDYGIAAPIQLRVFADRMEVLSPGALPNGVTPAAMRVGVSVRRNPFIVQYLVERGVMDALGRGVVLAVEDCLRLGLPEPVIVTDDPEGFVLVKLEWGGATESGWPHLKTRDRAAPVAFRRGRHATRPEETTP